ncbi:MAG: hypothetical protein HY298_09945 [Verrucomicrobia bacterium]|nr:hypothetical protein [Verrucomicrobiota bacterium]
MKAQTPPGKKRYALNAFLCVAALVPTMLKGDALEMINGDRYAGNLISVTPSNVTFRSEIQGTLNLPRNKVARISFGESTGRTPAIVTNALPSNPKTNQAVQLPPKLDLDSKSLSQVQQELLGSASPEARRQFAESVKGLMTGSLTIDDIRVQARKSVQDIKAAKEELGEGAGGVLDGYLRILEHFLTETDKPEVTAPVAKLNATNSVPATTPQK